MTRRRADDQLAQEADAADQVLAGPGDALAHIDEEIDEAGMPRLRIALELADRPTSSRRM